MTNVTELRQELLNTIASRKANKTSPEELKSLAAISNSIINGCKIELLNQKHQGIKAPIPFLESK